MSAEEVRFLLQDDVFFLVEDLGVGPVRDAGLLAAAVARPMTSVFGEDAYPDLAHKAAALLHSLCRSHPLVDGNKRLAWHAATVFLDINGVEVRLTQDEAFDLVMGVAEGRLDVPQIAEALRLGG